MKRADGILEKTASGLPQQSWTSKTSTGETAFSKRDDRLHSSAIAPQTKALVNMIFARFMAIYGHKFKSAFETEDEIRIAKREWALSLDSFSETELVSAVNHCKENLSWMPTISEFLEIICNATEVLGIPSVRQAYQEACTFADQPSDHSWSHPIVYWTGRQVGWFELRSETEVDLFPRFSYQFEINMRRIRAGEELNNPPSPVAIEDKSDAAFANEMLAYAKANSIDESVACKLLYYLSLPEGSRSRARQYQAAQADAKELSLSLPTEA